MKTEIIPVSGSKVKYNFRIRRKSGFAGIGITIDGRAKVSVYEEILLSAFTKEELRRLQTEIQKFFIKQSNPEHLTKNL